MSFQRFAVLTCAITLISSTTAIGQGTFQPYWCETEVGVPLDPLPYIFTLAAGDLDNDGWTDVVAGTVYPNGKVIVYWNNNGVLDPGNVTILETPTHLETHAIWSLRLTNLDNSGDLLDIVAADDLGEAIHIYTNVGNRQFTRFTLETPDCRRTALEVADFNGDGYVDISTGSDACPLAMGGGGNATIYHNDGFGGFSETNFVRFCHARTCDENLYVLSADKHIGGDIDLDGDIDLVVAGGDLGGRVLIMENRPGGPAGYQLVPTQVLNATDQLWSYGLALADYDNDAPLAYPDLLVGSARSSTHYIAMFTNFDSGSWPALSQIPSAKNVGSHQWQLDMGDADNDGNVDMLTATQGGAQFVYGTGQTGAPFGALSRVAPAHYSSAGKSAVLVDLNNDSFMESVVGAQYPSRLLAFENCSCPIHPTGDPNNDGVLNTGDMIYLVNYFFRSGPPPTPCLAAGDADCGGSVQVGDIIYLQNHILRGGPPPPCDICDLIDAGTWTCP